MDRDGQAARRVPPERTGSVLGDVRAYFLHRPAVPTLVRFSSPSEREEYSQRIMQRIGIDTSRYSVLNLHKIGIEAPATHVFNELLGWNGNSSCWPNHIATAMPVDDRLERITVRPLGRERVPSRGRFGWKIQPLFNMSAIRIQSAPDDLDLDNARYLLYACSGGYPIGIFVVYVRSSIADEGEASQTMVFLGVGFDFYGNDRWPLFRPVHWAWEAVHNRVTSNVLNRFKQLCEWRFERLQAGL